MDIKSLLTSVTPIEAEAWEDFEQYFIPKTIQKNEALWKEGDVCRQLVFIKSGLIRTYSQAELKEITTHFYAEGSLFYDDYSFIAQKPSYYTYEALEDCELIVIPGVVVDQMFDKYKSFERLGRMMVERYHIAMIEEKCKTKSMSSKDKYMHMLTTQANILRRVPLKIIASYLNMTPEHLSKIRKELAAPLNVG